MPATTPATPVRIVIDLLPDLELCLVEGGRFDMGDEHGDLWDACRPVHPVEVSTFYIGKWQVTQRLWQELMGKNPSSFKGDRHPVESVSWDDTRIFLKKINNYPGLAQHLQALGLPPTFRLPREAEWEYAARGGRYSQGYRYCGSDSLAQVGWYNVNSDKQTHDVGLLLPNELGIHDMSGNVYEWCEDRFDKNYYETCLKNGPAPDPKGPNGGDDRVVRGGSSFSNPLRCRPASRRSYSPAYRYLAIGLRLVLPFQSDGTPGGIL